MTNDGPTVKSGVTIQPQWGALSQPRAARLRKNPKRPFLFICNYSASCARERQPINRGVRRRFNLVPRLCLGTSLLEALPPVAPPESRRRKSHGKQSFQDLRSQAEPGTENALCVPLRPPRLISRLPQAQLRSPFQGSIVGNLRPRALPWATIGRPLGAMCPTFQRRDLNSYE
jgi:hypothetical protein